MTSLILPRRTLLRGLGALLCAPAIVRASSIMPVKAEKETLLAEFTRETDPQKAYHRFIIVNSGAQFRIANVNGQEIPVFPSIASAFAAAGPGSVIQVRE